MVETYDCDDAELIIVALGTTVESARVASNAMRKKGLKTGVASIRTLRPFPYKQLGNALKNAKAIATLDRSLPAGAMGMLFNEVAAAIYGADDTKHPVISNYIYGLGGRDLTQKHLEEVYDELIANAKAKKLTHPTQQFIGLRGKKLGFN